MYSVTVAILLVVNQRQADFRCFHVSQDEKTGSYGGKIMQENLKLEELSELLNSRQLRKLKEVLTEFNEMDIAAFLEEQEAEKTVIVFRMLPKETASEVFAFLEVEKQEYIINSITDHELGTIIEDLYVDDVVDMLEELPATCKGISHGSGYYGSTFNYYHSGCHKLSYLFPACLFSS